jgi:hypothetical protein
MIDKRNAFAKKFRRQINSLHDLPGFQTNLAQRRPAVETCTFGQKSVTIHEPLRKGIRIVRECVNNLERIHGRPRGIRMGRLPKETRRQCNEQDCRMSSVMYSHPALT